MAIKGLRKKLIQEATLLIANRGIEKFSVKDLSRKLKISHNTMYRHFKSKSELVYTILEDGFFDLSQENRKIIEMVDLQNRDKYKECAYASFFYAVHNPHMYKLMFATEFKKDDLPEGFAKTYSTYYNQLIGLIDKCIDSGEIKKGMKKYNILNTTWALLHGIAMLHINSTLPFMKHQGSTSKRPVRDVNPDTQISDIGYVHKLVRNSINGLVDSFFKEV